MERKDPRIKRATRIRARIKASGVNRLTIHKTTKHIYAQLLSADGSTTIASASTVQANIKGGLSGTGNIQAAQAVGAAIAKQAIEQGITQVAFDRSGFKYHGRVKALADAAREAGLQF
jgi:large subunit ribosomal protein L18